MTLHAGDMKMFMQLADELKGMEVLVLVKRMQKGWIDGEIKSLVMDSRSKSLHGRLENQHLMRLVTRRNKKSVPNIGTNRI